MCRVVDCVTIKGVATPQHLFTVQIEEELIKPENYPFAHLNLHDNKDELDERLKTNNKNRESIILAVKDQGVTPYDYFRQDGDMEQLRQNQRRKAYREFNENFLEGFENYKKGQWLKAMEKFNQCLQTHPHDGPTKVIFRYIQSMMCNAPPGWKGYRYLLAKE
jgi:hypothetical protein